jgi:hypothetical protein
VAKYRIAIVGSYNPARAEELQLKKWELAPQAGKQLGQELAKKNFHIIVYESYPYLLDIDVVLGYTEQMDKATANCIEVRYAEKIEQPAFIENQNDDVRFYFQPDSNENWEISFYQSIRDIDGMLLLGGGPSALIAGIVAISHRKAVVVCADFGGLARKVWGALRNTDVLANEEEIARMANPWTANSAERMIAILEAQIKRKQANGNPRPQYLAQFLYIIVSAIVALVVYSIVLANQQLTNQFWPIFMLISSTFTGIVGATAISLYNISRKPNKRQQAAGITATLGAVAGAVSAALFVLAQTFASPVSTSETPPILLYNNLFLFTTIIGLIAGMTFEAVFKRLSTIDVVQTGVIQAANVSANSDGS